MAELPKFRYVKAEDYAAGEFTLFKPMSSRFSKKPSLKNQCSRSEAREVWPEMRARLLECSCFRRTYLSATVRRTDGDGLVDLPNDPIDDLESGYIRSDDRKDFVNTPREVANLLLQLIFATKEPIPKRADGLVIVAGSTNSGKSSIVQALIHCYLASRLKAISIEKARSGKPPRKPHLITVEDPIEKFFAEGKDWESKWINYTPRELGMDVINLKDAINDALRQTPEVFYVGETRNQREWPALLEFARSGHLAVTTTHSGTLTEAMRNVFRAVGANTPAGRSEVASSLKAVVHLRADEIPAECQDGKGMPRKMVLPSIWLAKEGAMGVMEYGLSSVLQSQLRAGPPESIPEAGCLGRKWFADQLLKLHCGKDQKKLEKFRPVIRRAAGWDLKGA
jgi:hypothetical protein